MLRQGHVDLQQLLGRIGLAAGLPHHADDLAELRMPDPLALSERRAPIGLRPWKCRRTNASLTRQTGGLRSVSRVGEAAARHDRQVERLRSSPASAAVYSAVGRSRESTGGSPAISNDQRPSSLVPYGRLDAQPTRRTSGSALTSRATAS